MTPPLGGANALPSIEYGVDYEEYGLDDLDLAGEIGARARPGFGSSWKNNNKWKRPTKKVTTTKQTITTTADPTTTTTTSSTIYTTTTVTTM